MVVTYCVCEHTTWAKYVPDGFNLPTQNWINLKFPWLLVFEHGVWALGGNFVSLKWSCLFKVFDKIKTFLNSWGSVSCAAILKLIWVRCEFLLFAFEQVNFHEKYFLCCFSPYSTSHTDKWQFLAALYKKEDFIYIWIQLYTVLNIFCRLNVGLRFSDICFKTNFN